MKPKDIIKLLYLIPHPEGGHYKEIYRSRELCTNDDGNTRNVCTAIHYLLENKDRSNFHRIKSDECWFFHQGQPLVIYYLHQGNLFTITLGHDIAKGEVPYFRVPANTWFASKVKTGTGYSLVSCTVAPGFDFMDFELAARIKLTLEYPQLEAVIKEFTRV
jgi:uncharacterized protein